MRLIAFGGDARMQGALAQARRAGWEAEHIRCEKDAEGTTADAVLLPWPLSFRDGRLVGGDMEKEQVLSRIPPCRVIAHGGGVDAGELPQAELTINPGADEAFLRANAELTAEGAIARAMGRPGCALLGSTCMVTGFGRIGRALTGRLAALGAFVIVCARDEGQMRRAHEMGAHPVPIREIAAACGQADVIFNTVPARVLGEQALRAVGKDALVIELASAPYGADLELALRLGVAVAVESGLPGRYAPLDAGAALFDALQRAMTELGNKEAQENG